MEWMIIPLQLCFPPPRERGKSPTISPLNFQRQMSRRSTVQRTSTRSFDVARELEFGFDKQTASDLSANRSKRPFIGGRESRKEKPFFGLFCGEQYSRFLPCFDVRFRIFWSDLKNRFIFAFSLGTSVNDVILERGRVSC